MKLDRIEDLERKVDNIVETLRKKYGIEAIDPFWKDDNGLTDVENALNNL